MATAQVTRYEQVKQILDRAAAGGATDYDGRGLFWDLPLPQLLQVEIYGVRMIAPPEAPAASCCHHEAGADMKSATRSARSGLVQGLRGQPPFDGTQYQPLPWGGQTVPEEEIGFISDWIDDGCPASDHQISFEAEGATSRTLETIDPSNVEDAARTFEVYGGSPNEYSYKYGELKQRTNLDCMSESQVEKLRWAFRELYRLILDGLLAEDRSLHGKSASTGGRKNQRRVKAG